MRLNTYRVPLAYTTRTEGIDVLDTTNLFRQRELDSKISMLNKDDGTFLKVLDLYSTKDPVNQVMHSWIEDEMLPIHTKVDNSGGYNATAQTIKVKDALLFIPNSEVHVTRTLENMFVTDVNYPAGTIDVVRGWMGTVAAPLNDGEILVSGIAHLPEMADANAGTGRIPGVERHNFVSIFSESFKVSELQEVAAMVDVGIGRVATVEWEVVNKMFEVKRKVNKALIFQSKGTYQTAEGTVYCSGGFIHEIKDNVLNLSEMNESLSWPILSEWCDTLFEPTASSGERFVVSGNILFGNVNTLARDMQVPPVRYYHPEIGTDIIEVYTEQGNLVKFARDRHGFPAAEGLAGWGIAVDMKHAFKREYKGYPMAWKQNIQERRSHYREDEYYGSFLLELRHPECHGFIRGAEPSIL